MNKINLTEAEDPTGRASEALTGSSDSFNCVVGTISSIRAQAEILAAVAEGEDDSSDTIATVASRLAERLAVLEDYVGDVFGSINMVYAARVPETPTAA